MNQKQLPFSIFKVTFICLLSGCTIHHVNKEKQLLEYEVPPTFAEASTGMALQHDWNYSWWKAFDDENLNHLIESGLAANFELRQYVSRIEQATALARQAGARIYPSLDLDAGYQLEWDNETAINETRDRKDMSDLGIFLRWELDLWGRLSSQLKANKLEIQATIEDLLGARLLLSTAIAETYFDILEQRRQLEVIRAQIEINEELHQLTLLRFGQGQSSIVDVLQQQEQLEATLARVPQIETRIGQQVYLLDILLGKPPGKGEYVTSSRLAHPTPLPAVGIPAQLLTRRPDLRGAQKRVLASDYDVGVAVAEQLPTLTLGGAMSWRGDPSFSDTIYNVFTGLAAPLFDAGERRSEVAFRNARLQEALAGYSEQYLSALFEVEAVLLEERKSEERLLLVEQQLVTAQKLLTESRNRFSQGLTDYLPVFTSLAIVQNLEREVVSSQRNVLSARIGLHRALGGPMPDPDISIKRYSVNE